MNSHSEVDMNGEDSYRVEVLGWDAKENFFVEKTTLEWKPEDKNQRSSGPICAGCIVFVRLLQPLATATSFPIAYEALTSAERDVSDAARVSLERLRLVQATKRHLPMVSVPNGFAFLGASAIALRSMKEYSQHDLSGVQSDLGTNSRVAGPDLPVPPYSFRWRHAFPDPP